MPLSMAAVATSGFPRRRGPGPRQRPGSRASLGRRPSAHAGVRRAAPFEPATGIQETSLTLRGVLDVVLADPGLARVVAQAGAAELAVTAPPPAQPLVAAALGRQAPVLVVTAGERD